MNTGQDFFAQLEAATPIIMADLGGELIVYNPFGGSSTAPFLAIVERDPPPRLGKAARAVSPKMRISVPNSSTNGILYSGLNARDTITTAYRFGATAQAYAISPAPDQQDPSWLVLEIF